MKPHVGFFNPVSWGWDKISGWVDDKVADAITGVLGWLVTWILNAVSWIMEFVADIMASDALAPPDLGAEWFAQGIYKGMQQMGLYGAAVAMLVGVASAAAASNGSLMLKRGIIQAVKWGLFSGTFLIGLSLFQQVTGAMEAVVVSSAMGGDSTSIFEAFNGLADAASTSGALASLMVVFTGVILIMAAVFMIAIKVVIGAIFFVMAMFGPLVAPVLFTSRKDMLARYLLKLVAFGLAPFMMTATLALGTVVVMSSVGGSFGVALPPPPSGIDEPVDVVEQEIKQSEAKAAEEAAAGILVVNMISGIGILVVATFAPAAPGALLELTSDSQVAMATTAAVVGTAAGIRQVALGGGAAAAAPVGAARGALGSIRAQSSQSSSGTTASRDPATSSSTSTTGQSAATTAAAASGSGAGTAAAAASNSGGGGSTSSTGATQGTTVGERV